MQMQSVATSAGTAISRAPFRMASSTGSPFSRCVLMLSIATVASSTRMPTASARPPRVMMLIVSPSNDSAMIEHRTESGIEIDDERRTPTAQEQQDHEPGEGRRDDALAD